MEKGWKRPSQRYKNKSKVCVKEKLATFFLPFLTYLLIYFLPTYLYSFINYILIIHSFDLFSPIILMYLLMFHFHLQHAARHTRGEIAEFPLYRLKKYTAAHILAS